MTRLRILTLNTLFRDGASRRLAATAPLIAARRPSVVCLQEVLLRRNVAAVAAVLPTHRAAMRRVGPSPLGGLVTLTDRPIAGWSYEVFRRRGGWLTPGWPDRLFRKGFLATSFTLDATPVTVVNTHLLANYDEDWSAGNRFVLDQQDELAQLASFANRVDAMALLVVAGDLNVPAGHPMLEAFLGATGLRSAFGGAPPATTRGPVPMTIDHVLVRPPDGAGLELRAGTVLETKVRLPGGGEAFPSDHLAVEADIEVT